MKTICTIFIIILMLSNKGLSQQLSRQVVASLGNTYQNENISLSMTLGEPVVETFSANGLILSQGFQQSETTVSSTSIEDNVTDKVKIYPNPAEEVVYLDIADSQNKIKTIELYNLKGEKLKIKRDFEEQEITKISIEDIPSGIYFIRLINKKTATTYKLIKNK